MADVLRAGRRAAGERGLMRVYSQFDDDLLTIYPFDF
jgi:hypothetical protein